MRNINVSLKLNTSNFLVQFQAGGAHEQYVQKALEQFLYAQNFVQRQYEEQTGILGNFLF